jgi:alpha-1,3/alpha-1,6-mannosyltransferase
MKPLPPIRKSALDLLSQAFPHSFIGRTMRILIYHPWIFMKGGGERVVLEMAKGLSDRHTVTIAAHVLDLKNTFPEFSRFPIVNLSSAKIGKDALRRGFSFTYRILATRLEAFVGSEKYDLLIVSTGGIGELITIRNHSIPVICYCHTPLRALHDPLVREWYLREVYASTLKKAMFLIGCEVYRFLEKRAWRHFSHIICNSRNTRTRILTAGLAHERRLSVVYPGVGIEPDLRSSQKAAERTFLVPGRINHFKRQHLAIQAFLHAQKLGELEGFRLVIAGHLAEKDRGYFHRLQDAARGHENIQLLDSPDDERYSRLFSECYAVVFCAINEDLGIIPIEAQSHGKPVIAADEGGPQETVIDGESGFLVPASLEKIAEKMIALASDARLYERMSKLAVSSAQRFTHDAFTREIEMTVQSVVDLHAEARHGRDSTKNQKELT